MTLQDQSWADIVILLEFHRRATAWTSKMCFHCESQGQSQGHLKHIASLGSTDVDGASEDVDSIAMACTRSGVSL